VVLVKKSIFLERTAPPLPGVPALAKAGTLSCLHLLCKAAISCLHQHGSSA
jgi:hypothetical protein